MIHEGQINCLILEVWFDKGKFITVKTFQGQNGNRASNENTS